MARGKKAAKELSPEEKLQQALVPVEERPYPILENWCWANLGAYIDFATDYVANGSFASLKANVQIYKEENYALMVKTADFANGFSKSLTYTDKHGYDYLDKSALHGGELILSNIGSIGKVFRVPFLNRPMTLASNSIMIKCYNEQDYDWLYYFFLSPIGLEELLSITTGTAVLKFNKTDLKTIALPVPPLHKQRRIVDRIKSLFAKLDEAKEKVQAVVDGFELRKSAILHKAFTGELVGISDSRTIPLEAIVKTIKIGPFGSALHKEDYITGGVPVINPKHIIDQQIVSDKKVTITEEKASELMAYRLRTGDIIVGRRGEMGRSALVTEKENGWLCGTGSLIIRLQDGYSGAFYSQIIAGHSSVQYLEENCVGSTMKNLNEKIIKSLPVPNYTKEQQKAIVDTLNHLLRKEQHAKEAAEAVLAQIDTMKKAILARAFRGELGTNDPKEEWAGELLKNRI